MPRGTSQLRRSPTSPATDRKLATELALFLLCEDSDLSEMVDLIGEENALKLVLGFSGRTFSIPSAQRVMMATVEASAGMAIAAGESPREVANRYQADYGRVVAIAAALVSHRQRRSAIEERVNKASDSESLREMFSTIVNSP